MIRQCETSSGSRHKDTDQCLSVAISFCRHRSVPVPYENGSAEATVAEGGRNPVAGLWGHTLGENWPPEPTSSYASIDFWCQLAIENVVQFSSYLMLNNPDLEEVTEGHSNWYHIRKHSCSFLFAFHSNYSRIFNRLWDIQHQKIVWPWKLG